MVHMLEEGWHVLLEIKMLIPQRQISRQKRRLEASEDGHSVVIKGWRWSATIFR